MAHVRRANADKSPSDNETSRPPWIGSLGLDHQSRRCAISRYRSRLVDIWRPAQQRNVESPDLPQ